MNRQLRMGGGIMDIVPREPAILGGIKKAVKKVTKGVKKIASSDIGKAALIGAAAFGIPGTQIGGLFGRAGFGGAATGLFGQQGIGATLASAGILPKAVNPAMQKAIGKETVGGIFGGALKGNVGKLATLGAVSTFLTGTLGMSPEQAEEELARDPSTYLEQYYRNLNPPTADTNSEQYEQQVREFVTANTSEYAVGGRVNYQEAGPVLPPDPTQPVNPFGPKPIGPVLPDRMMASDDTNDRVLEALFEKYLDMGLSPKDAAEKAREEFERMGKGNIKETRGLAAVGGKMDTASDNAMQAAGIEGLPIRQNPKGVKELDLRNTGGFIQPVGIKEKEDDIPAMLSNNEFVFTADAVRGMGDGNVNVGAQRMYDMMKKLEAGGRV
jgi:hypothetical protein